MRLTELGKIVAECIRGTEQHAPDIEIHNHVIMPNHIHMIVGTRYIEEVGTRYIASANAVGTRHIASAYENPQNLGCLKAPRHGDACSDFHHNSRLSVFVGTFKAAVTRKARTRCIASIQPIWQSRYHEHIIRDRLAYDNITQYINSNIKNWNNDCFSSIK